GSPANKLYCLNRRNLAPYPPWEIASAESFYRFSFLDRSVAPRQDFILTPKSARPLPILFILDRRARTATRSPNKIGKPSSKRKLPRASRKGSLPGKHRASGSPPREFCNASGRLS